MHQSSTSSSSPAVTLRSSFSSRAKAASSSQSLKIFWSKASLGLRRGVVVGKIGMATSHLAVER
jgi:hypothetical protein